MAELPEAILGQLLTDAGLTLAVAESCTGGLIEHRITNMTGSSGYFLGGVVAYSYDAKECILRVNHDDLYDYGAVSEEVARQMADGVRRLFGVDLAVAVTGIAGPGGGLPGKPVGLVYIALSARNHLHCEKFVWDGDREANKASSADAALKMLVDYLSE